MMYVITFFAFVWSFFVWLEYGVGPVVEVGRSKWQFVAIPVVLIPLVAAGVAFGVTSDPDFVLTMPDRIMLALGAFSASILAAAAIAACIGIVVALYESIRGSSPEPETTDDALTEQFPYDR
ncbi:hypothetical protein [Gordonia sp. (in: high G+C Gram-positive bacteria)]|uniref:hypothetical protein n=1 Tax=Gordonia sp. (in: high G+C Gram-positive bacteria) TaxID=84139 RepID=UPI003341DDB4